MFRSVFLWLFLTNVFCVDPEEAEGVKYANKCEVCKVVATELETRLDETGKTRGVLEIGYSVDDVVPRKKKEYKKSELRLIESLESVCDRILEYNIHKERDDSSRFARGMSQTFRTLHGLKNKGVKVELGIPYELWDKPSAEITNLKTQCEHLLENHETDIEAWYYHFQDKMSLERYLCTERALSSEDDSCLNEKGDSGSPLKQKQDGTMLKEQKAGNIAVITKQDVKEEL